MGNLFYFFLAACCEITGCYLFWLYFRSGKPMVLLIPASAFLIAFAYLLTKIDMASAGRAYAAYGGIYIVCALAWMYAVEKFSPDIWDVAGVGICLVGASVILFAPR